MGLIHLLGPGLITGASDDDPSGIGTYSQAGSQFGLGTLWLAIFTFPLMIAVQEACARIALQTGVGLGTSLRRKFPSVLVGACIIAGLLCQHHQRRRRPRCRGSRVVRCSPAATFNPRGSWSR